METNDVSTATPRVSEKSGAEYLEKRLKPQLEYYERESAHAKRMNRYLSAVQLTATVGIPVVNVFLHSVYASSILAGVAALATGWAQIERYQERWLTYRQTASSLDTLRLRYELSLPPLDGDDRHDRLIAEGETLLGRESAQWAEIAKQKGAPGAPTILMGA